MIIELDLAKKHLNIEPEFTDDDAYILGLCAMAENSVKIHVNDDFEKLAEKNGGIFPPVLVQAMLLMIGNMYQNREPVSTTKVIDLPYNYQYLIDLYRNYNN